MMKTMCPFCHVEHESVEAMGTTVVGCPKVSEERPVLVNLPKRLTRELEATYLRAAVALEYHEWLSDEHGNQFTDPWAVVAWKAWDICNEKIGKGSVNDVDLRAARLLRECVDRNEELK